MYTIPTVKFNVVEHYNKNVANKNSPKSTEKDLECAKLYLRNQDTKQTDEINNIHFSILSSDEILKYSVAHINESKLSGEGSIYDARMGVIQDYNKCITCKGTNIECPGHFGHIELTYPVIHPLFMNQVLMYLNLFCSNCKKLCITEEDYNKTLLNKYKNYTKTLKLREYIQSTLKRCLHCNHKGYFYIHDDNNIFDENDKKITTRQIKNIFENITSKEMKIIGCTNKINPSNLILTVLPVLPLCARPYVETPNGLCDDDLTNKYVEIIKINNKLKTKLEKIINDNKNKESIINNDELNKNTYDTGIGYSSDKDFLETLKHLEFHIKTLMDNSKGKARHINGRPIKCFRERLNGKNGLFRNNLSGKRVDFSARTVIGPDSTLKANEIAIPVSFSKKLTFPERVSSHNLKYLESLLNENKVNYVIKDNGGQIYDINIRKRPKMFYKKNGFKLMKGDIIIRNNKKVDPEVYKQKTGIDITLLDTDSVVRNGKLYKNIKTTDENIRLFIVNDDRILRDGVIINPNDDEYEYKEGDVLIRNIDNKKEYLSIFVTQEFNLQLKEGDIVERHLKDGDLVLFGRQPTLHKGSMIARNVKIINENTSVNSYQPIKTIRMNLAATKSYNADFDRRM